MRIDIQTTQPPSLQHVQIVEEHFGVPLPKSYAGFLESHDGAKVKANVFRSGEHDGNIGVNRFIPLSDTLNEMQFITRLSERVLPFAWAAGGNYLLLNVDTEDVSFWDHETSEMQHVASTFEIFISHLEPLKVQLKPGQVKRVWVDPDLLKELKDNDR